MTKLTKSYLFDFSPSGLLLRGSWSRRSRLADVALHSLRHPFRHHVAHQHIPLLSHDLLMHKVRNHRKRTVNLWRLLHLWLAVRVSVKCSLNTMMIQNKMFDKRIPKMEETGYLQVLDRCRLIMGLLLQVHQWKGLLWVGLRKRIRTEWSGGGSEQSGVWSTIWGRNSKLPTVNARSKKLIQVTPTTTKRGPAPFSTTSS